MVAAMAAGTSKAEQYVGKKGGNSAAPLERIQVSDDKTHFTGAVSGRRMLIWGMNYGDDFGHGIEHAIRHRPRHGGDDGVGDFHGMVGVDGWGLKRRWPPRSPLESAFIAGGLLAISWWQGAYLQAHDVHEQVTGFPVAARPDVGVRF